MPRWLVLPLTVLVSAAPGTAAASRDRNHDRIPDSWEARYHLSTTHRSAGGDVDHDGLSNLREYRLRTNPTRKDTDRDGLNDGAEIRRYRTNPLRKDTDGDGYSDRAEVRAGTSPRTRSSHPPRISTPSTLPAPGSPAPAPASPAPAPGPPAPALVSPTPTPSLTAVPPRFPDASNTGVPAGTSLTPVDGIVTLDTPGEVYRNKLVNGGIVVTAPNVTIDDTKVVVPGEPVTETGIDSESTGLLIQDVEIDCGSAVGRTAIAWQGYTARRVNVHGCDNGMWLVRNATIEDSYIHDEVPYDPVLDPHTDGVQIPTGGSNLTIDHNTIYGDFRYPLMQDGGRADDGFGNSAITAANNMSNVSITNNSLSGGGYALRCEGDTGSASFVITGNRFTNAPEAAEGWPNFYGGFGPTDGFCSGLATTWSDNLFLDGPNAGGPVE